MKLQILLLAGVALLTPSCVVVKVLDDVKDATLLELFEDNHTTIEEEDTDGERPTDPGAD